LAALMLALWLGRGAARTADLGARLAVSTRALTAAVLLDCAAWWLPLPALLAWPAFAALVVVYTRAGARQLAVSDEPAGGTHTPPTE
jgi:uncharacterized membrane protein